jgi:hypothetical protein
MLRSGRLLRCPSAAAAAVAANLKQHHNTEPIATDAGTTSSHWEFAARYEQLRADKDGKLPGSTGALAAEPYEALMASLKNYDDLLRKYSVKQTEIERARAAARMCGLEWTRKKDRAQQEASQQQQQKQE